MAYHHSKFTETLDAIKAIHAENRRVNTNELGSRLGVSRGAAQCRLKYLDDKGALTRIYGKGACGIAIVDVVLTSEAGSVATPRQPRIVEADDTPAFQPKWDEHIARVVAIEREREERRRALLAAERAPKRRTRDFWDAATVRALSGGTMAGGIAA